MGACGKEYRFETDEGTHTLAELFDGRSQLLVYHLMFGPDDEAACPGCSFYADHLDGSLVHLNHHDVTLVCASRAPLDKIRAYRRRMGWRFPWVSSFGSDFNVDSRSSPMTRGGPGPATTSARGAEPSSGSHPPLRMARS